jgi:hypothetical protein
MKRPPDVVYRAKVDVPPNDLETVAFGNSEMEARLRLSNKLPLAFHRREAEITEYYRSDLGCAELVLLIKQFVETTKLVGFDHLINQQQGPYNLSDEWAALLSYLGEGP